ncbi:ParA family protein [Azospirillum sp.]|uniref:ParA family protein n=1 Tax=Azospirillum sp. TaxID=34012 RepID=UPI002D5D6123|nr:ParA family protein [Azospirillum sp.]HYD67375.1 ParA family protein [Azospirillum sp.]HYH20236.1 ParA family protein [Azospirillum sp.]
MQPLAPSPAPKRFLITNLKGGSGKTTLAQNLLVAAALAGHPTAGYDTDAQAQLAEWWQARPDEATPVGMYARPLKGMHEALAAAEIEGPEAVRAAAQAITDALTPDEPCEVLVIDTPPGIEAYPAAYKLLALAADIVVVPCQPNQKDRSSTEKLLDFLAPLRKPVVTVLSRVKPRVSDTATTRRRLAALGADVCPVEIPDLTEVHRAGERGLGVMEVTGLKSAEDMTAVWKYLSSRAGMA